MAGLTVLIVDDHPLARAGIRTLLDGDMNISVIGEATSGDEAIRMVYELKPDVVLMDVALPDMDGSEATRKITTDAEASAAVIALTASDREEDVIRMLRAGARGYVVKDAAAEDLKRAIVATGAGDLWLHRRVSSVLLETDRPSGRPLAIPLAPRETAVLSLLVKGYPNKKIASTLGLSDATIKFYVHVLYTKLGVDSRAAAAAKAVQLGITDE